MKQRQQASIRQNSGRCKLAMLIAGTALSEVCGWIKAYIAALIGGNKFTFVYHLQDEELIRNLISRERVREGQVTDTEPAMDDSDATRDYLNQKYSDPIEGSIQLQEDMKSVLAEYQDVDCKVKELEKQKTGLANQIKAAMGEYETGEVDGTVVSWKKISRESLDSKRLRKEQPEVFAEYSNISSYRKLSIA